MMDRIACYGLGKRYRVGTRERYKTIRDMFTDSLRAPANLLCRLKGHRLDGDTSEGRRKKGVSPDWIWAVKDLSFSVKPGEVVGIIGRNGAGKTTLLKILSRITAPTEGSASMRGRLGSLLEVGTGFHPELTGRENIFFNGVILGMKRSEVQRRFDEIVEFAEVERFIDTPVKRYSTGMYLRLAFAVAAHLETEILLVDEVLAVGDYNFQKKCIGKIGDIGKQGRTILFVSHSMPSVLRLCNRVLWLDQGKLKADGLPHQAVKSYLGSGLGTSAQRRWGDLSEAPGDNVAKLRSVRVCDESGQTVETIDVRRPVGIEMEYIKLKADARPVANLHFTSEEGIYLFVTSEQNNESWKTQSSQSGTVKSTCWVPGNFFNEGRIIIHAALSSLNPTVVHAMESDALSFQVIDKNEGDGVRGEYGKDIPGVIRPMLNWDYEFAPKEALGTGEARS